MTRKMIMIKMKMKTEVEVEGWRWPRLGFLPNLPYLVGNPLLAHSSKTRK